MARKCANQVGRRPEEVDEGGWGDVMGGIEDPGVSRASFGGVCVGIGLYCT